MNLLHRLLTHRMRPVDLLVFDILVAVAVAAVCVAAALEVPESRGPHEPAWLSVTAAIAIAGPLVVRRHWPAAVTAFVASATATALITRVVPDYAAAGAGIAIVVAMYALGLLAATARALVTAGGTLVVMAVALTVAADTLWSRAGAVAVAGVLTVPAWLIGRLVRERRDHAVRYQRQLVREAATEERLRLARDLHDVVGHSMSLIAVKASVAVHVATERPQEALDALRVIEAASREALTETRGLLAMLRDEDARTPPRAGDLRLLADRTTAAGVEVRLDAAPDVLDEMPGPLAGAVFLILQEALTNVVKHAAPAQCRATVTVDDETVRVEVVDNGNRPFHGQRAGHGLIGMRERAGLHGGTFAAGPRPDGGFEVNAELPLRSAT